MVTSKIMRMQLKIIGVEEAKAETKDNKFGP